MTLDLYTSQKQPTGAAGEPAFRHQNLGFTRLDDEKFLAHITWAYRPALNRSLEILKEENVYPYNITLVV